MKQRGLAPYLFLAPYLVVLLVFTLYPLASAAVLAFQQTNGPATRAFVGFDNFRFILSDPTFYRALENTTIFAACSVLVQLPLSMGLALLLNQGKGFARGLLRLVLFSPNLVGQIFVGVLFSALFTARYGLVNRFLQALFGWGLEEQWLQDPALVMPAIVITALWLYVGFNMIYFLAALQSVDKTLEEAARVDGATPFQVFWHVTLPSMRHVVVFVVVTSLIGSYQLFELPLALLSSSNGRGPDNAGLTVITYLYDVGFVTGDLGLGSAVGWVLASVIFALSLLQIRFSGLAEE
ncbi:MAG TPA: sugar ABC transporter permease [Polyangiaceae bacterium]|jgi:ABC-type sugar transport system permease subunit|nr:sugar ABC transporter permease [Polyangiaceae bacterium]